MAIKKNALRLTPPYLTFPVSSEGIESPTFDRWASRYQVDKGLFLVRF